MSQTLLLQNHYHWCFMYSNIPSLTLHWQLNQNFQLVLSKEIKYTPRSSQKMSCFSSFPSSARRGTFITLSHQQPLITLQTSYTKILYTLSTLDPFDILTKGNSYCANQHLFTNLTYKLQTFQVTQQCNFLLCRTSQRTCPSLKLCVIFYNILEFYSEI